MVRVLGTRGAYDLTAGNCNKIELSEVCRRNRAVFNNNFYSFINNNEYLLLDIL